MPVNGHLSWTATYSRPGDAESRRLAGTVKKIIEKRSKRREPPRGQLYRLTETSSQQTAGGDVAVFTVEVRDSKGRFVPDANIDIDVELQRCRGAFWVTATATPAWRDAERPESPVRQDSGRLTVWRKCWCSRLPMPATFCINGIVPRIISSGHTITSEIILPNQSSQGRRHMHR